MRVPGRVSAALVVALLSLGGVSCSGDQGFGGTTLPTPTPVPSGTTGQPSPVPIREVTVTAPGGLVFAPSTLRMRPRSAYRITFENHDAQAHTFTVEELNVLMHAEAGETVRVIVGVPRFLRGDTLLFYCTIDGHRAAGMRGHIRVR